jgi:hypothetical protein
MEQIYLSDIELAEVTELAECFYTPKEVAIMCGHNIEAFNQEMLTEDSPIYKAYWMGWYTSDVKFRKKVLATALLGSSPAQTMVKDMITKASLSKRNR